MSKLTKHEEVMPVNPTMLRWARETAGMSYDEVAKRLKRKNINEEVISDWEHGVGTPSYAQLETLAYFVFKRPLALFFFPTPPEEETPDKSFRTLTGRALDYLSPRIRFLVRQTQSLQENLQEIFDGVPPSATRVVSSISYETGSTDNLADRVRDFLGVSLAEQMAWTSKEEAFDNWREVFYRSGIFVFKDAFRVPNFSGLCVYHELFPVILVNNTTAPSRQIFTLFHELAHLLFKTGGIDTRLGDYIELLEKNERIIEQTCNQFASQFLVPDSDFDMRIAKIKSRSELLRNVPQYAALYKVSREMILRKLLVRRLVDSDQYSVLSERWNKEWENRSRGDGGDYYNTKLKYLGRQYTEAVFSRFYQNRISSTQLASYLGIKPGFVPKLELRMLRGGRGQ